MMQNKYRYIISSFEKKQQTQLKTKQVKQDILNQLESMGFPKLYLTLYTVRIETFHKIYMYIF